MEYDRKNGNVSTSPVQYEKRTENTPLSSTVTTRTVIADDYKQNTEVRRKRIIVLILLAIQLIFALFYFLESIIGSAMQKYAGNYRTMAPVYYRPATDPMDFINDRVYNIPTTTTAEPSYYSSSGLYGGSLIAALISLVYVTIFIIVVAEYIEKGIRVFAWLGVIQIIATIVIIVLTIIAIVAGKAAVGAAATGTGASVIVIVMSAISLILTVLTVLYAFKLANEIKQQEYYHSI